MGGRGARGKGISGGSKGTGKGEEILNDLLNGKTVQVRNPDNGVVFNLQHVGSSNRQDHFSSTVVENPKNARNNQSVLSPLVPGSGRFPSHLLISHSLFCDEQCVPECPVAIMDAQSGYSKGNASGYNWDKSSTHDNPTPILGNAYIKSGLHYADQGGASRYFAQFRPDAPFIYASKASRKERNAGCEALPVQESGAPMNTRCANCGRLKLDHEASKCKCDTHTPLSRVSKYGAQNNHPTVKSQQLMRYLVRMITPPNGVVLDCFAGSGSTLVAAISEGFHYVGIEQEAEYIEIINARIQHALKEKNIA